MFPKSGESTVTAVGDGPVRGPVLQVIGKRVKPIGKVHSGSNRRVMERCQLKIPNNQDRDVPKLTSNLQNIAKEFVIELEDVMRSRGPRFAIKVENKDLERGENLIPGGLDTLGMKNPFKKT